MNKKCIDCESDNLMKYAELKIQYEKIYRYSQLLEKSLDILRKEHKELKNKLKEV